MAVRRSIKIRSAVVRATAGRGAVSLLSRWDRRVDRYWHRSSSCLGTLLIAHGAGLSAGQQAAAAAIGLAFGGGKLSPDVDQMWATLETQSAGDPQPWDHHGLTHCPWPPLVVAGLLAALDGLLFTLAAFVPVAWIMHDIGDMIIGKGGPNINAGVPIKGLWDGHVGLGLYKSGGRVCRLLTIACWVAIGLLVLSWGTGR